MQSSRNYFTPFLPDVPVTRLPDYVKPRLRVEAVDVLQEGHAAILRVIEFALLAAFIAVLTIAGSQVPL